MQRLDATLKAIEGFPTDQVDKVIALGLIDVRDIEEVGAAPLMEELGIDETVAQAAVERCAAEAKIVVVEQEKKKADSARAKALAGVGAATDLAALIGMKSASAAPPQAIPEDANGADDGDAASDKLPGAMESSEGGAPEVTVHKESSIDGSGDMSPEEQAVHVMTSEPLGAPGAAEDDDEAALAEGRVRPPLAGREGLA